MTLFLFPWLNPMRWHLQHRLSQFFSWNDMKLTKYILWYDVNPIKALIIFRYLHCNKVNFSENGSWNDETSQVMSNEMAWISLGISFEINWTSGCGLVMITVYVPWNSAIFLVVSCVPLYFPLPPVIPSVNCFLISSTSMKPPFSHYPHYSYFKCDINNPQ